MFEGKIANHFEKKKMIPILILSDCGNWLSDYHYQYMASSSGAGPSR